MTQKVESTRDVNDCMKITDQGSINLSNSQKNLKANHKNNDKKYDNERNSGADQVNQYNRITKENIDKEKFDAWRNLKYMTVKQTIKHKLPLMPPPERDRNMIAHTKRNFVRYEKDKQRKGGFDIDAQTDPVYFVTEEDYELIQYIKDNGVTREAIVSLVCYDDDDLDNDMNNHEDLKQEPASQPKMMPVTKVKSGGEEQDVYSSMTKFSEENRAKPSEFIASSNDKNDPFTDKVINKNKFFECIHNSLWQIVIYMSRHRGMIEHEKIKSCVDHSTQTPSEIMKSKKEDNIFAQIANRKEITMSQLSPHLPNVTEYDILEQKMQVLHGNYQKLPFPQMPNVLHPKDPRAQSQHNQQAKNEPQKPLIKRPRLNSSETRKESAVKVSNNAAKTNIFSWPRWQFDPSRQFGEGQQCRWRYVSNMTRPQLFNVMSRPMHPPPPLPPPPPPPYNQEPRFTNQHTSSIGQYQILTQRKEMTEYQKYQQMEMQKKAWESQLHNYPNSAWSYPLQEN